MTTAATAGYGVLLKAGDGGGSEVFTTIAEIRSITFSGITVSMLDVTNMDSPDSVREFLPTLSDGGELQFEGNFLPGNTTHQAILTDLIARTRRNFKVVFNDTGNAEFAFAGFYTNFAPRAEVEGIVTLSCSIKITSTPVLTP